MRLFETRRRKVFGGTFATLIVAAIAAVGAFAYYGGSGSGTASASAGHSPELVTVTVNNNTSLGTLYPGDTVSVPYTIQKNTGNGTVHIGSVSGAVTTDVAHAACVADSSWFTFSPGSGLPANVTTAGSSFTGSLTFNNLNVDQSACSDAPLTLTVSAAPTP